MGTTEIITVLVFIFAIGAGFGYYIAKIFFGL